MTAPTITELAPNLDASTVGQISYRLEIKGQPVPDVKVVRLQDLKTGKQSVEIRTPLVDGKPVIVVGVLDAIARKILPAARVAKSHDWKDAVKRRVYEVPA
jgi:hypothetical protein